ncbi:MAG: efflux RND transporter periplasmic adaptor subunit [Deltaproteobacteria bacterium]|nr:efflux RND transporter periplasmic adaptor subunit [Deltaproteobacteria bacterium]
MRNLTFLFVIMMISAGCSKGKSGDEKTVKKDPFLKMSEAKIKNAHLEIVAADPRDLKITFDVQGEFTQGADSISKIVPRVGGLLKEFKKKEGDKISKGEIIAILESRELGDAKLKYIEMTGKVGHSWTKVSREKSLVDKKISSKENYLAAQAAYDRLRIELEVARQKLMMLGITAKEIKGLLKNRKNLTTYYLKSPLDGKVTKRQGSPGEMISGEKEIYTITDLSMVKFEARVSVGYIDGIKVGDEVSIFNGKLKEVSKGIVDYISPSVDTTSRTVLVRVKVKNISGRWRPGLCGLATFISKTVKADVAVPVEALHDLAGKSVVFSEKARGVFEMHTVIPGKRDSKYVQIMHGLSAGKKVVTKNSIFVKSEWMNVMGE